MSTPLSTALLWGSMGKRIPWKQPKVRPPEQPPKPIIDADLQQRIEAWVSGWKELPAPAAKDCINHALIMQVVCREYNVHMDDILGHGRTQALSAPRHIICYLTRQHVRLRWTKIGRLMRRDHASIMHGWRTTAARRCTDVEFHEQITRIEQRLEAVVKRHRKRW